MVAETWELRLVVPDDTPDEVVSDSDLLENLLAEIRLVASGESGMRLPEGWRLLLK